jgi:hypothetical protein
METIAEKWTSSRKPKQQAIFRQIRLGPQLKELEGRQNSVSLSRHAMYSSKNFRYECEKTKGRVYPENAFILFVQFCADLSS